MIRDATTADLDSISALAEQRRLDYERAQPQYWRRAVNAVEEHRPWLAALVDDPEVVALVSCDEDDEVTGYLFVTLVSAPPVYDPGGPTGLIDDFSVTSPKHWASVGVELLAEARDRLASRGVSQLVVVCGHHDQPKREALLGAGLSIAAEWFIQPVSGA